MHNVKTALDEAAAYTYAPAAAPLAPRQPDYFQGYLRADGRAAVRNELWIIPTVGCVNDIAQALAAQNRHLASGGVEAVRAFRHPFGCSQMGDDHARTRKLLAALCRHPNAEMGIRDRAGGIRACIKSKGKEAKQWHFGKI